MNHPPFNFPRRKAFIGKVAERVAHRFCQATAAADEGTIPSFSEKISQNGRADEGHYQGKTDEIQAQLVRRTRHNPIDTFGFHGVRFEGPEVREIVFGFVHQSQKRRYHKRKTELKKRHRSRANDLIPIVPVFHRKFITH